MDQQAPMDSADDIDTFRAEFLRWEEFLNSIWGILAFTFALGCLGTHVPWINAWICCAFLVILRLGANNQFPQSMRRLRLKAKDDPAFRQLLQKRTDQFLGNRVLLIRYPLFLMGWICLAIVMFSRGLVMYLPWLNGYFGYDIH